MTGETKLASSRGGALSNIPTIILGTMATLLVVLTLVWQSNHLFMTPIYDDIFDRLRLYTSLSNPSAFLSYMISGHNEHRIMTTRLVAMIDEFCFAGREYTQVITTNGLLLLSAFLACRYAFFETAAPRLFIARRFLLASVVSLLLVNPNFFYTLVVPFQLQHAIMTLLVVIAALVVSRLPDSEGKAVRPVIALVLLATIGSFTLDNAPAILLAAAAASIIMRCRAWLMALLSGLAIIHTLVTLLTTGFVSAAPPTVHQMIGFALVYWGAPFQRLTAWPSSYITWEGTGPAGIYVAAAFGGIVLATAVLFSILRFFKPNFGGRLAMFGLVILMAVIATGCAAAHSRAQFGILEAANKKYSSFAALGWLGAFAVITGIVDQLSHSKRSDWPAVALLLVMLPLSTLGYFRETRIWQRMIDRTSEASLAVFVHAGVSSELHSLYTDDNDLLRYVGFVEPRKRGLFSYFPFSWGDNSGALLKSRQATQCRGAVERISRVSAGDLTSLFKDPGDPYVISGWAWMDGAKSPPESVIAVDKADRIVGVARMTRSSDAAEEWLSQKFNQNLGWFGYARLDGETSLTFFGLSADGSSFCRLSGLGETP